MTEVLIAGCGELGTAVGLRLARTGVRVHGLRRSVAQLPAPIIPIAADLRDALPSLPREITGIVYAATADERTPEAYRRTYVDGPRHVLDALDRAGATVTRLVFVSSTAVYGIDDGSEVDELTPAVPATPTGRILLEAEVALRSRHPEAIALRLGGIYGPGRTRLIDQVRDGGAVVPSTPVHTNRIHLDDAAAAVVHLLTEVPAPERCYLGVDDDPADRGEVLRFLAAELGVPPPGVGRDDRRRGGDKRCSNRRLRSTGWRPAFPSYREGYRPLLAGDGHTGHER